jgi:hypothetical protein
MKTLIMNYNEFNAGWILIIGNNNNLSLCKKFFSEFYRSTISLHIKLEILAKIPTSNEDIQLIIETLEANYDSKLYANRDYEWARFVSNLPIKESVYVSMKESLKMSA